jgi:hypothetical protein
MEICRRDTLYAPDRRKLCWPDATPNRERQSLARSPRLARTTIGFWLGGAILGTGGCILGVCMPYHHPVAVVISALWWGIYFGCFGGSIGALLGLWAERTPAPLSQVSDGLRTPLSRADSIAFQVRDHRARTADLMSMDDQDR